MKDPVAMTNAFDQWAYTQNKEYGRHNYGADYVHKDYQPRLELFAQNVEKAYQLNQQYADLPGDKAQFGITPLMDLHPQEVDNNRKGLQLPSNYKEQMRKLPRYEPGQIAAASGAASYDEDVDWAGITTTPVKKKYF